MIVPSCGNCAYSDDGHSPADKADGEWLLCRRRPPLVFSAADDGYDGGEGIFPRVDAIEWCGEWVQCCVNTGEPRQRNFLDAYLETQKDRMEES